MLRPLAWAAALLSAFSHTALAQEEPGVADRGGHSILVGWGSSGSIGYWRRLSDRTDLGFEVGVSLSDNDDTYSRALSLRPGIKRYLSSPDADVAPYIFVGLAAQWGRVDSGGAFDLSTRALGALGAVGVDWFPVQRVSIGGHLGIQGLLTRQERSGLSPLPDEELSGYDVATYSSGVRVSFYF
jgi:hypothetical protein